MKLIIERGGRGGVDRNKILGGGIIRYTRVKDFRFRRGQIKTGYTGNEAEVKLIMFSLKLHLL